MFGREFLHSFFLLDPTWWLMIRYLVTIVSWVITYHPRELFQIFQATQPRGELSSLKLT